MSRDIAGSNSAPLTAELFHTSVYKPNQGRIVRQLTCLAIWVVIGLGCWALYSTLRGSLDSGSYLVPGIPALAMVAGAWFGFRVHTHTHTHTHTQTLKYEKKKINRGTVK